MIVIPERGRSLIVQIDGRRGAWCPIYAPRGRKFRTVVLVPSAGLGVSRWNVRGGGQIPRLRISIALVRAVAAVQMRDDWHRTTVRLGIVPRHIALRQAARWIGPMKRLIDRQQMRQEPAATVDQLIQPGCAD